METKRTKRTAQRKLIDPVCAECGAKHDAEIDCADAHCDALDHAETSAAWDYAQEEW